MKYTLLLLFILSNQFIHSQTVTLRGKIRCMNPTPTTTKGAENIVVVPTFAPSRTAPTATYPSGYFEINTGLSIKKLQDKTLMLQVISKCANCRESVRRVFISSDQTNLDPTKQKQYTTIKDWLLKTTCQEAELKPAKVDSITNVIMKQGGRDLNYMPNASVLTGTPALLNLLTTLTTVAGAGGIANQNYGIQTLGAGAVKYGDFLNSSSMLLNSTKGFTFSPTRDLSEAVFWNPSAIAFSPKANNISLLTNLKNNGRLGGFFKVSESIKLGAGLLFSTQDEYRSTLFKEGNLTRLEDSIHLHLKEYGSFLSGAYQVNEKLSFGVSGQLLMQQFNIPDSLFCDAQGKGEFINKEISTKKIDASISATYRVTQSFQLGINVMNLANAKLNADAYSSYNWGLMGPRRNTRMLGLGMVYKNKRLHSGLDILINQDGLYDLNVGLNYVPFNNALITAGLSVKQLGYSLAFRLKHFRIAYINDANYMINQKRIGRNNLFQGNLYGGFVFDLN